MQNQLLYSSCILILLFTSCSVAKKIPAGDKLYNGATVTVTKDSGYSIKKKNIEKQLEGIVFPKKNTMLLGFPYKVWLWYVIGKPKRQKGLKYWLSTRFGEPPVLGSSINTKLNDENILGYLDNIGYYRSEASSDTTVKGYKLKATYQVKVAHPYFIDSIEWKLDSGKLLTDILQIVNKKTGLKKGDKINLDNIKQERTDVDLKLKTEGYYYFNPDFVIAYVDTSHKNYNANIYLSLKPGTPQKFKIQQYINNIIVFPNYSLLFPPPDTSLKNLEQYDGIYIRDTVNAFKPVVFSRSIIYRGNELYSITKQNKTLNRLINLGAFKFVKNRFEPVKTSTDSINRLNVFYYLTPQKRRTIQADIGGFSKSNSYTGAQASVTWTDRNLFKGAEIFSIKTYGSFETSSNDSLKAYNNFHLGTQVSLTVPKFIVPFRIHENNLFPPQTQFSLGYELLRKEGLYTSNSFRLQYEMTWKNSVHTEQTIAPVSITYTTTSAYTQNFLAQLDTNRPLQISNFPEIICATFYNYLTSTSSPDAKNIFYFNANAEVAGNLLGLITGSKTPYSKKIGDAYFAQYVKADIDFRYTRKLGTDFSLANRIIIGAGSPYGNSQFLPFSRQYIIGGSSSLRGFEPREIGPGTTKIDNLQLLYYPQVGGDYKLELNSELRFPLFSILKGAIFADAGNIWTKDTLLYSTSGLLKKDFLRQLGFDAGIGIRADLNIFVLRLDLAIPLAEPWLPEHERWVGNKIDFGSSAWRSENLIFNIAIGYPF